MLAALSLASGFSGLVYEVLWAKELSLLFGGSAAAQMVVLATFLGGLALGNAVLGRRADLSAPLRLYGRLELGIAACGLLAPLAFRLALWAFPARYAICVAAVLVPTFLMGGTIPALARAAAPKAGEDVERAVARLYSWNCAGAVAGALAAGYFLIAALGLDGTAAVAASVNALCGLAARRAAASRPAAVKERREAAWAAPAIPAVIVYEAAFLAGIASLVYETGWVRILALVMGGSSYSFSAMLAGFIAGIALGSRLLVSTRLGKAEPAALFGWAQLGVAAAVLASLPFYERLPYLFRYVNSWSPQNAWGFSAYESMKFLFCFALMAPATTLIGMTLPLMSRLEAREETVGRAVGSVFAANTLGNVAGALFAYRLLPALGLEPMLRAATTVSALVGLSALAFSLPWPRRARLGLAAAVVAAVAAHRAWVLPIDRTMFSLGDYRGRVKRVKFSFKEYRASVFKEMRLVFVEDDPESSVTILRGINHLDNLTVLKINGKTDASNSKDMETQVLCAEVPMILKPGAEDVLVIGLGSGVTAGSTLRHPSVRRLDVVELSPGVPRASSRFFRQENGAVLEDPRTRLRVDDAKAFLRAPGDRSYDLVISEPSNPWMAGVANLFTADFYADVRRRLKPGGVMTQWFHLYEMDDDDFRLVLRTFSAAFPHVTVWNVHGSDVLLLGSDRPISPDWRASERESLIPAVLEDLGRAELHSLAALLSLQQTSDATARRLAGPGPVNTDRRPRLEYSAPKAYFRGDSADIVDREDDRLTPEGRSRLLLSLFQARRPLTTLEFMDVVTVKRSTSQRPVLSFFIDEWARLFPKEPRAALARFVFLREEGRLAEAKAELGRLKRLDPHRDVGRLARTLNPVSTNER